MNEVQRMFDELAHQEPAEAWETMRKLSELAFRYRSEDHLEQAIAEVAKAEGEIGDMP